MRLRRGHTTPKELRVFLSRCSKEVADAIWDWAELKTLDESDTAQEIIDIVAPIAMPLSSLSQRKKK
jgi:hypothetical protein